MQVAVISDLHLGARGAPNYFQHDDGEFLRFLSHLERNFERIVLLGDIWETLAGKLPGDPQAELQLARAAHPEIARRFAGEKYFYVHGNHDLVAGTEGAPEELWLEAEGTRIVFTHGHQRDALTQQWRMVSELGVWLGGWVLRAGLEPVYDLFRWLEARGVDAWAGCAQGPFQRWAVGLAQSCVADVVVTGHTHLAARTEHGSCLYLNSGSCSEGEFSYLSLDTRHGEYRVHHAW
jgi:predicted phosphodiesterase